MADEKRRLRQLDAQRFEQEVAEEISRDLRRLRRQGGRPAAPPAEQSPAKPEA